MIKHLRIRICLFILFLAFSFPAYAYLDPGTFSIVLQSIFAGIAGLVATYRLWIFKFKSFFKSKKDNKKGSKTETNDQKA